MRSRKREQCIKSVYKCRRNWFDVKTNLSKRILREMERPAYPWYLWDKKGGSRGKTASKTDPHLNNLVISAATPPPKKEIKFDTRLYEAHISFLLPTLQHINTSSNPPLISLALSLTSSPFHLFFSLSLSLSRITISSKPFKSS